MTSLGKDKNVNQYKMNLVVILGSLLGYPLVGVLVAKMKLFAHQRNRYLIYGTTLFCLVIAVVAEWYRFQDYYLLGYKTNPVLWIAVTLMLIIALFAHSEWTQSNDGMENLKYLARALLFICLSIQVSYFAISYPKEFIYEDERCRLEHNVHGMNDKLILFEKKGFYEKLRDLDHFYREKIEKFETKKISSDQLKITLYIKEYYFADSDTATLKPSVYHLNLQTYELSQPS